MIPNLVPEFVLLDDVAVVVDDDVAVAVAVAVAAAAAAAATKVSSLLLSRLIPETWPVSPVHADRHFVSLPQLKILQRPFPINHSQNGSCSDIR